MNDDELTDVLRSATDDIHPADRLDELLARKRPGRRRAVLGLVAAAAVAAVVLIAVQWSDSRPQRITTYVPPDSTTVVDEPRVGDEITVTSTALPAGMRLLDELPRSIGQDDTVVSRFARDDRLWNGDGPYLRITLTRGDGVGATWSEADRGTPETTISGQPAYLSAEPLDRSTEPTEIASQPWSTLAWSPDPDEVIQVQARGIDVDEMVAIAQSVSIA